MGQDRCADAPFRVRGDAAASRTQIGPRNSSPAWTGFGLVLAAPATVLLLIQIVTGDDAVLPYSSAFEAVLYFYAAGALIAYMLEDHEITRDEMYAVGATFTLVAWAFAYAYTVCQAIEPGTPWPSIPPASAAGWSCCS